MTRRRLAAGLGLVAAMTAAAALLQTRLGVATREFTSDDAGHLATMAVLRSLLLGGHLLDPIRTIVGYYEHYQIIGLGLWPPAFHMLGALWTSVFGVSRASVMTLQAAMAGGLAAAAVLAGWRPLGMSLALAAGVGVLLSPLVVAGLAQLQADVPTALSMLLAALAFRRLLDRGRVRDGLLFGVAALVAVMTKGNALALAFLPAWAILISGRWGLLRRPGFWVPAAVILPVAGPWYALTYSWASAGFRYSYGWGYTSVAAPFIAGQFWETFGPVLLVLAAVAAAGLARRRDDSFTVTMLSLVLATVLFQAVLPAALEARYLMPTVAPTLLLAARGALLLGRAAARRMPALAPAAWPALAPAMLALGLLIPLLLAWPEIPASIGARLAGAEVLRQLSPADPVLLIVSDAPGEGAVSVELLLHEGASPRVTAARGSRLLGGGGYNNHEYASRFATPEEAMALVDRLRIPVILLDRTPVAGRWAHVGQVAAMLDQPGAPWERVSEVVADGRTWQTYRRRAGGTETDRVALAALLRPNKGPKVD